MEKEYIKNYFRIICDMPLRVLVKNTRDWTKEIRNAKNAEYENAFRELRAACIVAYNLTMYCDLCNAIFKKTRRGYKIETLETTKYFYTIRDIENYVNYNLDCIPLATISNWYAEHK